MSANFGHIITTTVPETFRATVNKAMQAKASFPAVRDIFVTSSQQPGSAAKPGIIRQLNRQFRSFFGFQPHPSDMPRFAHTISADERILPGYIHPAQFSCKQDLLSFSKFDKEDIKPDIRTGIRIGRWGRLRTFLKSQDLAELRQSVPTVNSSSQEELAFLRKSNRLCAEQLTHSKLSVAEREEKHVNRLISDTEKWMKNELESPVIHPLDKTVQEGDGVCIHQALLNKIMLDSLGHNELQTTLHSGFVKRNPLQAGKFHNNSGSHAWTMVTMPSKQEYLVDPSTQIVIQVTRKLENGQLVPLVYAKPEHNSLKAAYVSFSHLLEHGNPDFIKP